MPSKINDRERSFTSMILLSRNNSSIEFIDAHEIFFPSRFKGKRINDISEEQLDYIINMSDATNRVVVPNEEIITNGHDLSALKYFRKVPEFLNGIKLSEVLLVLRRGKQLSGIDTDRMECIYETDYRYLAPSSIQDGVIDEETVLHIEKPEKELSPYITKRGDIILTKNGKPFKVTLIDTDTKKYLVNGNCFILRPNVDYVRPLYLKCFLESAYGTYALENAATDSGTPSLSVGTISEIVIPNISVEKQLEFEEEYLSIHNQIKECKQLLKQCREQKEQIFDSCFDL